jgi:hypothetical protein
MDFKQGDMVRQKVPLISGPIQDIQFNKSAGELEYLLAYTDSDGNNHFRWFVQSDLEAV